ncbi:MAG: transglycosylase SLT domain-containing protein [Gammaproteobacteria bacterium]
MLLIKPFAGAVLAGACLSAVAQSAPVAGTVPNTGNVGTVAPAPVAPAAVASTPAPAPATVPLLAPAKLGAVTLGAETRADDDNFFMLRESVRLDNAAKVAEYGARLGNYPLQSYVEYYRIKPRLRDASAVEVRDFLARYQGTAIADRLRNDWLLELGRARDWTNFDQQLPLFVTNDDLQVKCYALLSRLNKGQRVADEARALLNNPPAYGEGCAALMAALAQTGQFSLDDLLAQLRLAGEAHATGPAKRIALLLGASDTRAAQAVDLPAVAMARGVGVSRADHEIYLVAVGRMARTSLKLAAIALRKNADQLSPQEVATGWASIAHAASLSVSPDAAMYWQMAKGAPLTLEQMQWKTRIALRRLDWKQVRESIEAMPESLRSQSTWTYWLARALQATGAEGAGALYQRIADQNGFYGQLALEELGQQISIPPRGAPITAEELAPMAANPGLRRALKFFSLRMRPEGTREWNWELRRFSERELLAAAEFARTNGILDRMVSTSERTRTQFDYTQRFPSPHFDILHPTTSQLRLDQAWVYGLIRQESRFVMDAQSSVGASGLMQVMPSTAAYVARKIGLADYVHTKLADLHTNLVLGANYMSMVLNSADGNQALASAAYNAGPGRMRSWRSALEQPMEGAIFAETIPFTETRVYVKNVLANATTYAALFDNKPQSLKARLGKVSPRTSSSIELP